MTAMLNRPADLTEEADPRIVHPHWCDLDHHVFDGSSDQRHVSSKEVVRLAEDLPDDPAIVSVWIQQYAGRRPGTDGPWEFQDAEVLVHIDEGDKGCVALSPEELGTVAGVVARLHNTIEREPVAR